MTLAMVSKIIFPETATHDEIVIRKCNSVRIESSWELLTDTAVIVLPRNVKDFDKLNVKAIFKKGDPVEIYLGYDENLLLEFTGFISEVSADIPVKIKCDDYMYLLKKHSVNVSMKSTKLEDLIKLIIPPGIEYDVADINIGTKRFPNTTAAKILEELQGNNIYSYFKGKKLIVGKIYSDDVSEPVVFNFTKNVIDNNLQYKNKEDVIIKIIANSTLPKGKKLKVEYGDDFGTEQHLSYYNITLEAELLKLAKADYDKFKVDGFEGHITVFGTPSVIHGMKAQILSYQYPDRKGLYFIKKVVKEFDDSPKYHQTIDLDKKAE
ncbi:hypothetical protein [Flavobacterium sp. IMCC34518]|uniref:hypothetical protein n=1 Tax=Flavobacterium sp. IMCC34518 TaxID=3003623 RepID=UPI0022AC8FE2|nr:hypothetical protein [Flavobacterium sp. IMCC34518]